MTTAYEPSTGEYDALGRRISAEVDRVARRERRTRQAIAIGAATAALSAVGAVWLASSDFQDYGAYCYSGPSTSASYVTISSATEAHGADGRVQPAPRIPALEMCAAAWRIGAVGPHATQPPIEGNEYAVPDLVACLRGDGVTAVFPDVELLGETALCARQGLAVAGP